MTNRSRGGCYTCKRRKKKCDETQPLCLRCTKAGKECEGYAPLESPDDKGVMRRAKPAPRQTALTVVSHRSSGASKSLGRASSSNLSTSTIQFATPLDSRPGSCQPLHVGDVGFPPPGTILHPNNLAKSLSSLAEIPFTPFPKSNYAATGGATLVESRGSEDRSSYQSLQSLAISQSPFQGPDLLAYCSLSSNIGDTDLGEDPEGTKQEMCIVPILDPNIPDNALPFVLQCYAQWTSRVVFEPSKVINQLKEGIISRFARSSVERHRVILLSNIIGMLGKSMELGPQGTLLVTLLRTEAHQTMAKYISDRSANEREVDRRNALEALSPIMELVLIHRYSSSMSDIVTIMKASTPVFRRACLEIDGQRINLPRALMSPDMSIRHFATTDVIISMTTGRPMLCRYDTTYPPNLLEQIKAGRSGMHWLHGIADQYIVILARINILSEELGASVSPECVTEIEDEIRQVDIRTERSVDPVSTIWRYTVRACWKVTMYVYLYMVLCRASSADPRVLKWVKSFVKLIESVEPGRNPDAFLYSPLIIIGVSAYRKPDQALVRRRLDGLKECAEPGRCGREAVNRLADVWKRADAENRPAVWHDLRVSTLRVAGV